MALAVTFIAGAMASPPNALVPDDPSEEVYYESASGQYELEVIGRRDELGRPSRITMRRDGLVIWSRHDDRTFWDAAVTDSGRVIGCAYYHAPIEDRFSRPMIEVHVLSPKGKTLLRASEIRRPVVPDSRATPTIESIVVLDEPELACVTMFDWNDDRRFRWWIYDLVGGQQDSVVFPRPEAAIDSSVVSQMNVIPLQGSMLVAHWYLYDATHARLGSDHVVIHKVDGTVLWSSTFEHEEERLRELTAQLPSNRRSMRIRKYRANQLIATAHGFRFHSASRDELIEYRCAIVDGDLQVDVSRITSEPFEIDSVD